MREEDIDWDLLVRTNKENLKDLGDGEQLPFWAARGFILIGYGYPAEYYDLATESGAYHGTVTIDKGGITSRGSLTFTDMPANRSELEEHIAQFSQKEVKYA